MQKNQPQRYILTYKKDSNIFTAIQCLETENIEIYSHNIHNRQLGVRITQDKLEAVKKARWLEEISSD